MLPRPHTSQVATAKNKTAVEKRKLARGLDIVDAAAQLTLDNTKDLEAWIADGRLSRVSDEQAVAWVETNALVWSLVLPPWILVQGVVEEE